MKDWLAQYDWLLKGLLVFSTIMFVGTLLVVPMLVARIPADYFVRPKHAAESLRERHPVWTILGLILKNLVGLLFIVAGLVMLILPGQGLLTILLGVMLLNFPGKRRLERKIISRPKVFQAVNWLRAKAGREPLEL